MGKPLTLTADDSHRLGAYRADPAGKPKGGVVVIQEIFDAALKEIKSAGPTAIMGFCMGGTIAFLAACRLSGLAAAVCYYGGGIGRFADEKPKCLTLMHFGRKDAHIPMTTVDDIRKKRPDTEIHVYDEADHGFHCDERGSYHGESARIAWGRTLAFLEEHMK